MPLRGQPAVEEGENELTPEVLVEELGAATAVLVCHDSRLRRNHFSTIQTRRASTRRLWPRVPQNAGLLSTTESPRFAMWHW